MRDCDDTEGVHGNSWSQTLVSSGLIPREAYDHATRLALSTQTPLSAVLTRLGLIDEKQLARRLAEHFGMDLAQVQDVSLDQQIPGALNRDFCQRRRLAPVQRHGTSAPALAMADPSDEHAASSVEFVYGCPLERVVVLESEIDALWRAAAEAADGRALPELLSTGSELADDAALLADQASDAPVIRLVTRQIAKAVSIGASDIHFEPTADSLLVRFRVDGDLGAAESLSRAWSDPVISRIKLMAKLDIAEKRLPQDGRIKVAVKGRAIDLRVATFPILNGESAVLRVLGQQQVDLDLTKVGLAPAELAALQRALAQPNGLILVTGPTGSGKTTTLYAALCALRRQELKLVTVEDPIEYTLPGVAQLQVKPEIGLDYPAALRAVLRNDPDVIMVGEIRDRETADIAVRAALTGHLVLATLHTNSAAGAITRLLDLGVQDFLLCSTLALTSAQRLVRKLCPDCRRPRFARPDERAALAAAGLAGGGAHADGVQLFDAAGCPSCLGRGFRGRVPVFEAVAMTRDVRATVRPGFSEEAFTAAAASAGARSLQFHGLSLALAGVTTMAEVLAVVGGDE